MAAAHYQVAHAGWLRWEPCGEDAEGAVWEDAPGEFLACLQRTGGRLRPEDLRKLEGTLAFPAERACKVRCGRGWYRPMPSAACSQDDGSWLVFLGERACTYCFQDPILGRFAKHVHAVHNPLSLEAIRAYVSAPKDVDATGQPFCGRGAQRHPRENEVPLCEDVNEDIVLGADFFEDMGAGTLDAYRSNFAFPDDDPKPYAVTLGVPSRPLRFRTSFEAHLACHIYWEHNRISCAGVFRYLAHCMNRIEVHIDALGRRVTRPVHEDASFAASMLHDAAETGYTCKVSEWAALLSSVRESSGDDVDQA